MWFEKDELGSAGSSGLSGESPLPSGVLLSMRHGYLYGFRGLVRMVGFRSGHSILLGPVSSV